MSNSEKHSLRRNILFPAVTMMLGWGLRGYIGGGPFGAMIPGAMVAFAICLLADLSLQTSAIIAVFGAAGIGIGGEMTYGQTLGFLKEFGTTGWGELGIFIKGGIWGLLGGAILATGIVYKQLSKKTIIIAWLFLFLGMLIGFKLIHQPKLIYFSGPDKPRFESWAAFLFGAIAYLFYLRSKTTIATFRIISSYAFWGMIGGSFGFGLGGFWMVLGNHLGRDVIFQSWWKAMEFTFGALFGGGLGFATWINRKNISTLIKLSSDDEETGSNNINIFTELIVILTLTLFLFWLVPWLIEPFQDPARIIPQITMLNFADIMLIISNFAFLSMLMILIIMKFPGTAWQISVTLIFSHTVLDLLQDIYPDVLSYTTPTLPFIILVLVSAVFALVTSWVWRRPNALFYLFILLIWSCMATAFLRLNLELPSWIPEDSTIVGLIFGTYFVHLVFLGTAFFATWYTLKLKENKPIKPN